MLIPIDPAVNRRVPYATYALIALNTAIFLLMFSIASGSKDLERMFLTYGAVPAHLTARTIVTHMFLHAHAGHLVGNMVWLAFFGLNVERRLGPMVYLLIYFLSGLSSIGLFLLFMPHGTLPLVGASGAISGVVGMYVLLFGRRIAEVSWIFGTVRTPAYLFTLFWVGTELLMAVFLGRAVQVAHWAHVGGFFGGALAMFLLNRAGFRQHADEAALAPKNLAESFTELRYIPVAAGPADGSYALFFRRFDGPPVPGLPRGASPACAASWLSFRHAEDLRSHLAELGLETVIVSDRGLVRLPPLSPVNLVERGIRLRDDLGRSIERAPEFLYLLAAGVVGDRVMIDLFFTSPWSDYRVSDAVYLGDFVALAVDLRRAYGETAFLTPEFRHLSEGARDRMRVFATQGEYDAYNRWVLQNLAMGVKP